MFEGVHNAGVGVGDMDKALDFWGKKIGFNNILFDYTGPIPGLSEITKTEQTKARIVMLEHKNTTRLGPGLVKLVQRIDGDGPPPLPAGIIYGEIGLAEVCLHVRDVHRVFHDLVDNQGCEPLMYPLDATVPPDDITLEIGYVADPWRGKVELIDWTGLHSTHIKTPRIEGVNHVAFGVSDMKQTQDFYRLLGFDDMIFESTDFFEPMAPWYPPDRQLPSHHMTLTMGNVGAGVEPVRIDPLYQDCRGEWGHVGPMEFSVGVRNIESAVAYLNAHGIQTYSDPQVIDVGNCEFKYVYFKDPDGQFVCLTEILRL